MVKQKYLRQFLPIFLSLIVIVMSTIFVSAAEKITLSVSNVTEWPVAEGEIYVGQVLGEHITFVGGKVVYGGVEVPGHFEHFVPTMAVSLGTDASKANLKFVPENTDAYTGFNILMSANVTFEVKKTTPVLMDTNNPPVASKIKEGQTLSESTITGGTMRNPYNSNLNISSTVWKWDEPNMVVTESGEYLAKWVGNTSSYEIVTEYIYVEVEKDQKATALKTMPSVNFDYNPNITWGNYEFEGAVAVVTGTDIEIPGTFSVIETLKNRVPSAGSYDINIVFTPEDAENYIGFTTSIPVKVNPLPISFNDSEGNFVVDGFVFTAEPGTKMSDIEAYFKGGILNYPPQSVIGVEDRNSYAENGRTYKLTVIHDNPNYVGTELYFTVAFNEVEFTPTIAVAGNNKFRVDCGKYSPDGTFTITCNGKEIAEVKAGRSFDCVVYTDEGGTYEITAKYNPVENDYFTVNDASYSITVNPARNIATISGMHFTVNGSQTYNAIRTGDVIELNYTMPEFAYYVVKDGSGKTVTLDGVDLTSKKIKFTMPDCDLDFTIKTPAQLEQEEATANCKHLCHSENPLVQMIWKLLHIIFRLFNVQQFCDCGITHYDAPVFGFFA